MKKVFKIFFVSLVLVLSIGTAQADKQEDLNSQLMSVLSGNADVVAIESLIKQGADVNARAELGRTALMHAAGFSQKPKIIEILIKKGADVNARDARGSTALIYAAIHNQNPKAINTLIKYGADVNARCITGSTSWMFASMSNPNPKVIETLIKHGADVKVKNNEGKTALDYAKDNPKIYQTDVYWKMNDMMYQ